MYVQTFINAPLVLCPVDGHSADLYRVLDVSSTARLGVKSLDFDHPHAAAEDGRAHFQSLQ
jgi:hypothetical protein